MLLLMTAGRRCLNKIVKYFTRLLAATVSVKRMVEALVIPHTNPRTRVSYATSYATEISKGEILSYLHPKLKLNFIMPQQIAQLHR